MDDRPTEDYLEHGIKLFTSGDATNALKYLSQAVQSNPKSARAWYWLGKAIEDSEKKSYCMDRANSLDPLIEIKESSSDNLPSYSAGKSAFTSHLEPSYTAEKISPFPFTKTQESTISEDGVKTQPIGIKPESDIPAVQSFSEFIEPKEKEQTHIQPPELQKISKKNSELKKKESSPSKMIFFLFGLLFSLILFGFAFSYFINTGMLDGFLFIPMSIMGDNVGQPNIDTLEPTIFSMPPTFTPTIAPSPTAAPVLDFAAREQAFAGDMKIAQDYLDSEENEEAIWILNSVIEKNPDYARAYYMRGTAYRALLDSLHAESEYEDYLNQALSDFNQAIELNPYVSNYYLYRAYDLWDMANVQIFQKDREPLFASALDNIQMAKNLGSSVYRLPTNMGILLNFNGRCDEGANLLSQQIYQYPDVSFHYSIHAELATSYLCLKRYSEALDQINQTIDDKKCDCDYRFNKANILYAMGRKDEALTLLNESIDDHPGYQGYRYYLRALIYYDQGKTDSARSDIETGAQNTWGRPATYYYLLSKFALEDGEIDQARLYMQYADAANFLNDNPVIVEMVKKGMTELELKPLEITNEPKVSITPMPADLLDKWTPSPVQSAILAEQASNHGALAQSWPFNYNEAIETRFEVGIPKTSFNPNQLKMYHLVPKEPIIVTKVFSLTFYMLPQNDIPSPMRLKMFTHVGDWNETYVVSGGDNPIEDPWQYIGDNGDFFIRLYNSDETDAYSFESAGFIATVQLADGSTYTYGLTESPLVQEWENQ